MRVVVTGGAGFIGGNLTRSLLASGHEVLVIDDLSTGSMDNLDPRAAFRKLDILDDGIADVIGEFAPDGVVHLAAQASVAVSLRDPARDRLVNAEGTRRVALAARQAGARRMISASSAAVYGTPESLPLTETSRTEPLSPYGESKLEAESLLAAALRGSDTDYASVRFSNVYGPRQDAAGEGGVVAIFCDRLARGEAPIIHGDGRQTRDFIFVGDVVAALSTMLAFDGTLAVEDGSGPAGSFNVSTGVQSSIEQLLMAIRVCARFFGPAEYVDTREGDIADSVLDAARLARATGWKSNVDLETGIAMTWRWFESLR